MTSKMDPMEEDYSICRPYFDHTEIECVATTTTTRDTSCSEGRVEYIP